MNQEVQKKKRDPQIIKDLWSTDDLVVLKTLLKLRSNGNLTYVPDLLNLLSQPPKELIEKELVVFLADIKVQGVIPIIVKGLQDPGLKAAHVGILSAIWQSGLDYSKHLHLFIQLFLEGDYLVALESFTVIEQSIEHLSHPEIEQQRKEFLDGMAGINEDKMPLARELVSLLQI